MMSDEYYVLSESSASRIVRAVTSYENDVNMDDTTQEHKRRFRPASRICRGVTMESIAKGASGNVRMRGEGAQFGSEMGTGEIVRAYNRSLTTAANKWVTLIYFASGWDMYPAEC